MLLKYVENRAQFPVKSYGYSLWMDIIDSLLSTLLQHKNFKRKCKTKLYVTISSNHIDPKMY